MSLAVAGKARTLDRATQMLATIAAINAIPAGIFVAPLRMTAAKKDKMRHGAAERECSSALSK